MTSSISSVRGVLQRMTLLKGVALTCTLLLLLTANWCLGRHFCFGSFWQWNTKTFGFQSSELAEFKRTLEASQAEADRLFFREGVRADDGIFQNPLQDMTFDSGSFYRFVQRLESEGVTGLSTEQLLARWKAEEDQQGNVARFERKTKRAVLEIPAGFVPVSGEEEAGSGFSPGAPLCVVMLTSPRPNGDHLRYTWPLLLHRWGLRNRICLDPDIPRKAPNKKEKEPASNDAVSESSTSNTSAMNDKPKKAKYNSHIAPCDRFYLQNAGGRSHHEFYEVRAMMERLGFAPSATVEYDPTSHPSYNLTEKEKHCTNINSKRTHWEHLLTLSTEHAFSLCEPYSSVSGILILEDDGLPSKGVAWKIHEGVKRLNKLVEESIPPSRREVFRKRLLLLEGDNDEELSQETKKQLPSMLKSPSVATTKPTSRPLPDKGLEMDRPVERLQVLMARQHQALMARRGVFALAPGQLPPYRDWFMLRLWSTWAWTSWGHNPHSHVARYQFPLLAGSFLTILVLVIRLAVLRRRIPLRTCCAIFLIISTSLLLEVHMIGHQHVSLLTLKAKLALDSQGLQIAPFDPLSGAVSNLYNPVYVAEYRRYLRENVIKECLPVDEFQNMFPREKKLRQFELLPNLFQHQGFFTSADGTGKITGDWTNYFFSMTWSQ
jgi:hypothetical protein